MRPCTRVSMELWRLRVVGSQVAQAPHGHGMKAMTQALASGLGAGVGVLLGLAYFAFTLLSILPVVGFEAHCAACWIRKQVCRSVTRGDPSDSLALFITILPGTAMRH